MLLSAPPEEKLGEVRLQFKVEDVETVQVEPCHVRGPCARDCYPFWSSLLT